MLENFLPQPNICPHTCSVDTFLVSEYSQSTAILVSRDNYFSAMLLSRSHILKWPIELRKECRNTHLKFFLFLMFMYMREWTLIVWETVAQGGRWKVESPHLHIISVSATDTKTKNAAEVAIGTVSCHVYVLRTQDGATLLHNPASCWYSKP